MSSLCGSGACLCAGLSVSMSETVTSVGSDCVLKCSAQHKPGVQYRSLMWYKVGEPPSSRLSGLLTKDLLNGTTRWYIGLEREVDLLGESRDILLPNVTCADAGVYECQLAAPVGEKNREGQVLLTLTDCVDGPTEADLVTDTYLVIFAAVLLMVTLLTFFVSYVSKESAHTNTGTCKHFTTRHSHGLPLLSSDHTVSSLNSTGIFLSDRVHIQSSQIVTNKK
ncbi:CD83 antigen isoform X1 [Plectropomus leopardus]|uniref:CD83 antigen isoform X1 n=1 Tax=Plectropomus leopardus TaxID=160734 RepID=UPI001C4D3EF1|nr:CD83 antigen isoform X1 [Plectropomus leopardus]